MSWGGETREGEREGGYREEEGSSPTCKKRVEGGTYGAQRRGRSLSGMREGEIEWMIRKESRLGIGVILVCPIHQRLQVILNFPHWWGSSS